MTLDQLQIFIAVADMLSMTRAAERLHMTQPSISAAIAALEERHATRLFDRVGRRLELNEAGRAFLPEARAVLARADAARQVLADLSGLTRGTLRIAASQTLATYWLPRRMARFAAHYPDIDLTLRVGNTMQTAAQVMAGDADIGFVEGKIVEDLLAQELVGGDRISLYCAPDHHLMGTRINHGDLEKARWVLREPGSGTRDHTMAGLAQTGVDSESLQVVLELPSNGAVLEAVEAGDLITAVSDLAAAPRVAAGTITRLAWPLPDRTFTMLTHRARRPARAMQAFIAQL